MTSNGRVVEAAAERTFDQLRNLTRSLRDRGIDNPVEVMRSGLVALVTRCLDTADRRGMGAGWLAAAIKAGGAWDATQPRRAPGVDELTERRLRAFDELYRQRTGKEWSA